MSPRVGLPMAAAAATAATVAAATTAAAAPMADEQEKPEADGAVVQAILYIDTHSFDIC